MGIDSLRLSSLRLNSLKLASLGIGLLGIGSLGISLLGRAAVLSGLAIVTSSLPGMAIDFTQPSPSKLMQIAQAGDTLCRQTNDVTGIYQQPNIFSISQGVLPPGQTVRLEVVGTGTGWSRIREPIVGWIEARFLTPPTPCAHTASAQTAASTQTNQPPQANLGIGDSAPVTQSSPSVSAANSNPVNLANSASLPPSNTAQSAAARPPRAAEESPLNQSTPSGFPSPTLPAGRSQVVVPPLNSVAQPLPQNNAAQTDIAARPTLPPIPAIVPPQTVQNSRAIVVTTCDVLPPEGLAVRRQPDLNTAGASILAPGTYNFQFTGATQTVGGQRLAYIVAPAEGWIQVVSANGVSTLGGGRCG